jgi:PIN domain nuclease of toxin-antitoxin system
LREKISASPEISLRLIDEDLTDATTAISHETLTDPRDRFIVATAKMLSLPLVTKDEAIRDGGLVATIWQAQSAHVPIAFL